MKFTMTGWVRCLRRGKLRSGLHYLAAVAVVALATSGAYAQPCPCNGDVNLDGLVDEYDFWCVSDEVLWDYAGCPNTDVNCDGVVDGCDMSAVDCLIAEGLDCCDVPCGACCFTAPDMQYPTCEPMTETLCMGDRIYGVYQGDGVPCRPSPCDCQFNGFADGDDIAAGTSQDCNDNGIPDECEWPPPDTAGACCVEAWGGCSINDEVTCLAAEGVFYGYCTTCPNQNLLIVDEGGGEIFIHVIGPPVEVDCNGGGRSARACVPGDPKIDAWESSMTCHSFGVPDSPPIPADFFGPGSDPYGSPSPQQVCLQGVPLGDTPPWGDFGDADTLIERSADPFDRCALPSPTPSDVDIEIVALSLASTSSITVTYNGGMTPEYWDVTVDLSTVTPVPTGSLTATKTHCNGGMYTSQLYVYPRFTFTPVGGGTAQVLDTGTAGGWNPIALVQFPADPWVHDVDPLLFPVVDPCSDFHAGINDPDQIVDCDCQPNGIRDKCDIEGASSDTNGNGIPDECEGPPPTEACCLPDGSCVVIPDVDCMAMGGVPQGPGTMCTTAQACCFPTDTCAMVDPLCCGDLGGTAQGLGSACGGMQACCDDATGACYMADEACCLANGHTPKGGGSVCLGDADANGKDDACEAAPGVIPTVSTWGLVVMALLLLVAGKVYFGWRRSRALA